MMWFGTNKASEDTEKMLNDTFGDLYKMPEVKLSEEMVRRDNFFHSCWMLMKRENPQLSSEMQAIELTIAGYAPEEPKIPDKDKRPEGIVL